MASIPLGEVAQVLIKASIAQHHWFLTLAWKIVMQQVAVPLTSCSSWDGEVLLEEPSVGGFGCHWGRDDTDHCTQISCLLLLTPPGGHFFFQKCLQWTTMSINRAYNSGNWGGADGNGSFLSCYISTHPEFTYWSKVFIIWSIFRKINGLLLKSISFVRPF